MSKNEEIIVDLCENEDGELAEGILECWDKEKYPFIFELNEDEGTAEVCGSLEDLMKENATYEIPSKVRYSGEVYTVTGAGDITYGGDIIEKLIIPDSVTEIWGQAIANGARKVVLPNNIKIFYDELFQYCDSLIEVNIPESLTEIWDNVFEDCHLLSEIVLPNGLTKIGECAFARCYELSELTIPASVEEIGEDAFKGCSSLQDIWIENAELDYSRAGIPETATIHVGAKGGEKPQAKASSAQEVHTREEWIEKSSPVHLEVVDAVVKSINKWTEGGEYTLTYKKEFVGMNRDGIASNWVYFKPRRKKLMMFVKVGVKKQLYTILNGCMKDQFSVMNENDGYELEIPIEDGKKPAMDWLEAIEPVLRQAEKERMKK